MRGNELGDRGDGQRDIYTPRSSKVGHARSDSDANGILERMLGATGGLSNPLGEYQLKAKVALSCEREIVSAGGVLRGTSNEHLALCKGKITNALVEFGEFSPETRGTHQKNTPSYSCLS